MVEREWLGFYGQLCAFFVYVWVGWLGNGCLSEAFGWEGSLRSFVRAAYGLSLKWNNKGISRCF